MFFALVWFEVPMHNAVVVQILQSQDCFSKVHPRHFYRQWAHVFKEVGTISPWTKAEIKRPNHLRITHLHYRFQSGREALSRCRAFTFDVLHDHAEMSARFERAEHGDDEGVLCKREDVSLHEGLLDLVPQDQVLTVYLLHGKPLASLLVADQIHSATKREINDNSLNAVNVFNKDLMINEGTMIFTRKRRY